MDQPDVAPGSSQASAEEQLREAADPGFFADFWDFLKTSRKWWLLPLLIVFLLLGLVLVLANTAAAPLIYTLF